MKTKKWLTLLLVAAMLTGSLSACGETAVVETESSIDPAGTVETKETVATDPYAEMDLGGIDIRMMVSDREIDNLTSSITIIQHGDELTGEVVSDAVYNRNMLVEEMLNIHLCFEPNTQIETEIPATITQLITAGDDAYELIIHELFPLATLSVQNHFYNVYDVPHLDFTKEYWYEDYMRDVSFDSDSQRYILAGDYFLDILRSAHALYFNKDRFNDLYGAPEDLYDLVLAGNWTYDVFLEYATAHTRM